MWGFDNKIFTLDPATASQIVPQTLRVWRLMNTKGQRDILLKVVVWRM